MQPQTPQVANQYKMSFHGDGLGLALVVLRNIGLAILTLGVYGFWGKVNTRRYLWHSTEFHGQRFNYHGTGMELLKGYMKVIGLFGAIQLLSVAAARIDKMVGLGVAVVASLCIAFLVPYAIYNAQRYLYSRTSWRGIRLGMAPDPKPFMKAFLRGYVLTIISLGFYSPVWVNQLYRIRMDSSRVGTLSFRYTGKDRDAFFMFLKALPLIIVTAGIYFVWYKTKLSRFRAANTWIGGQTMGAAHGHLQITGGEYFGLIVMNVLCLVLTLGLAAPWIIAHNLAFFLKRFSFVGNVDFDQVAQVQGGGDAAADGLADALNVGFGV